MRSGMAYVCETASVNYPTPKPVQAKDNPTGGHWGESADIVIVAKPGRLIEMKLPGTAPICLRRVFGRYIRMRWHGGAICLIAGPW